MDSAASIELFVPGRICLFGEHSDWAAGYRPQAPEIEKGLALICGTDQGLHARVGPGGNAMSVTSTLPDGTTRGPHELPMEADPLLATARAGGFWSYVAGVAYEVLSEHGVGGLEIDNHATDLPVKKGLSSSAAVCVLTARAFNLVYDLGLDVRGEMELAYRGEIRTPSRCGRLDQGCAFGKQPVLMEFDGDALTTAEAAVGDDLYLLIVDLGGNKDTREILARLNDCYPAREGRVAAGVRELFGPTNRQLVGHAAAALREGDGERIGSLMREAQALFDRHARPACPHELTAPRLHAVLEHAAIEPHVWGGKGVGSQGDGAAQLVARSENDRQQAAEILQSDLGFESLALTIRRTA